MPFTTIVAAETLAKGLGDPDWLVLDARFSLDDEAWGRRAHAEAHIPGALYADLATDLAGEIIPGHIPGARLADRTATLGRDGRFRPPEELRAHYLALFGGVPTEQVIFYCGSGVTAAQNLVALAHAGLGDARHYVGSWSEWILDPRRPIEL